MPMDTSKGPRFSDRLQVRRQLVPEGALQEMSDISMMSRLDVACYVPVPQAACHHPVAQVHVKGLVPGGSIEDAHPAEAGGGAVVAWEGDAGNHGDRTAVAGENRPEDRRKAGTVAAVHRAAFTWIGKRYDRDIGAVILIAAAVHRTALARIGKRSNGNIGLPQLCRGQEGVRILIHSVCMIGLIVHRDLAKD